MAFVKGILDGKTASDAYRDAYDVGAMPDQNIWAEASKLRNHHKVAAWLAAARRAHLASATITADMHIHRLQELQEMAIEAKDIKAAIGAEKYIGEVAGHYTARSEITINNTASILHEISRINPGVARLIADQYSIPLATIIDATPAHDDEQDDQPTDAQDNEKGFGT